MKKQRSPRLVLKQNVWKLALAQRVVNHVQTICHYIQNELKNDEKHPMFYPSITALCIIYGRLFTDNDGIGTLPTTFLKKASFEAQGMHKNILEARNHLFAHSDAITGVEDSKTKKKHKDHVKIHVGREDNAVTVQAIIVETSITCKNIPCILELCRALQGYIEDEGPKNLNVLFFGQNIFPGIHEFNLNTEY